MMQSGGTSPALDDPPLPEFSGATLHLQQQAVGATSAARTSNAMLLTSNKANPNEEIFVDLVDLSLAGRGSSGTGQMEAAEAPTRKRRNTSPDSSESIFTASPLADGMARGYFSSRDSLLQRALHDCKRILIHHDDGPLLGNWLLTQVDHWDNEKERLILLFGRALIIFKYDFIALVAHPDYVRLPLNKITHLTIGRLGYPARSITPKVQQVASRVSSILRGCLQQLGQEAGRGGGLLNMSSNWRNGAGVPNQPDDLNADSFRQNMDSSMEAGNVRREREGVRLTWKVPAEPKLAQLWNPWSKEIPWLIFVSHPLLSCRTGQHDPQFDVHDFISNIRDALQSASPMESPPLLTPQTPGLIPPQTPVASTASLSQGPSTCRPANGTANECCLVEYSPILMESYIGLPALLHNYGQLGFYKIRGRISF